MSNKSIKAAVRYSQSFKIQIVSELETGQINIDQIRRKYGLPCCATIRGWLRKHGNGTVGKIMRVETPKEIDETAQLKQRLRHLEKLLVDANLELAIERATSKILAERAGVENLEEFKKKAAGP